MPSTSTGAAATTELRLLHHVLDSCPKGDARSVVDAIDAFGWGTEWMMNVGDVKGKILDAALAEAGKRGAKTFVELGAYCGYSAVRIASQIPKDARLFSIELSPTHAEIARAVIDHAGLSSKVQVIVGNVDAGTQALQREHGIAAIDFLFIDHHKDSYVRDFNLIRSKGLLPKGSIVVADNLLYPGSPEYIQLMTDSTADYHFEMYRSKVEYSDMDDIVGVSVMLT